MQEVREAPTVPDPAGQHFMAAPGEACRFHAYGKRYDFEGEHLSALSRVSDADEIDIVGVLCDEVFDKLINFI